MYFFEASFFICTFDLPALAKVACITQFNGKFSCPKCYAPGQHLKNCWIFPVNDEYDKRTDEDWLKHSRLAAETKSRMFGIKGFSPLLTRHLNLLLFLITILSFCHHLIRLPSKLMN